MRYASEAHLNTSVADWKPAPPERFVRLLHTYEVECCDEHGHEALTQTAFKHDHETTGVIYYMPKSGKRPDIVSSPVLLTIRFASGKVMCFESTNFGAGKLQPVEEAGQGPHTYIPDPDGDAPAIRGVGGQRRPLDIVGASPTDAPPDDLIKHMVNRFLGWRLPDDFNPDDGISFKAEVNEHTAHPSRRQPTGTNLFTYSQAEKMVRQMFAGYRPRPYREDPQAPKDGGQHV